MPELDPHVAEAFMKAHEALLRKSATATAPARQCGECNLCCRVLPVKELGKKHGERCLHQRHTGCKIYGQRPLVCKLWSCRWLVDDDAADLRRPDRSGYVVDIVPDTIRLVPHSGEAEREVVVVQIWVDPKRPRAYRDPALFAWLERKAADNILGLVRFDAVRAVLLWPPSITHRDDWVEMDSDCSGEKDAA